MLLPLQFNDGRRVPASFNLRVLRDLRERFGGVSIETQKIQGEWISEGIVYRDELVKLFVDVPDTPATDRFFKKFKEELKRRYKQVDIWMTSYPIAVI
jgi:hypothetical protein